jgi:hypothetical protein
LRYGYTPASTGGDTVIKKVLIGTVAAAAIILGIAYWTGYPPVPGEGTEATVRRGAAVSGEADVRQGRRAWRCVRAEVPPERGFDRLMKNEKARAFLKKASKDPELKRALTSPEFLRLMRSSGCGPGGQRQPDRAGAVPRTSDALRRQDFADAMHSDAFLKLLARRDIQAALTARDFEAAMKAPEIAQQFTALDLKPQYAALIDALNAELAPALANVDLSTGSTIRRW